MRIGLQGWGSEGDLRPVVALAAALHGAGHTVQVDLTAVDGTDLTRLGERLGFPIRMLPAHMPFDLQQIFSSGSVQRRSSRATASPGSARSSPTSCSPTT